MGLTGEDTLSGGAGAHCTHPARRIFAWTAYDGTLCAGCCECGALLTGIAPPLAEPARQSTNQPAQADQPESA